MSADSKAGLYRQLLEADEAGVRLEMVMGQPSWEFHPSPLHQMILREVQRSLKKGLEGGSECECFDLQDAYILFPDGSFKRPDLSIFCRRPTISQNALTEIPDAVVEIVSPGSELKDLQIGPSFYLSQGIRDVVVHDPRTGVVMHYKKLGHSTHSTPVRIGLDCGCSVAFGLD